MPLQNDYDPSRAARADRRPILSVCTILILSGFLLGMTVAAEMTPDLRFLTTMTGLAGIVAFLGLDHVSQRRQRHRERAEQDYVENRLVRHVDVSDSVLADQNELAALARAATTDFELEEPLAASF